MDWVTHTESSSKKGLLSCLKSSESIYTVELRPPPSRLSSSDAMTNWIDLNQSIRTLARADNFIFLTDDAVGSEEEENLAHISSNVGADIPHSRIVPFLTCNHTLEHCLMYVDRLKAEGYEALTVLGGDSSLDVVRCFPHSFLLREQIRLRHPNLTLGGWMNPHREINRQVSYLSSGNFNADYYMTQIVSHHSLDRVEMFLEESVRKGVTIPGVFGVFYYWGATPKMLEKLSEFFPVPVEQLKREFAEGGTPESILARTIEGLKSLGIEKFYLSNLGRRRVKFRLDQVISEVSHSE